MFTKDASIPEAPATLTDPQPAERAKGLISNSDAPAEPARCGFPANADPISATEKSVVIYNFNFILFLCLECVQIYRA